MTTTTELLPPNAPAPPKVAPTTEKSGEDGWSHGLKSKWPVALDLAGSNLPCRLEGEVENLVRLRCIDLRLLLLSPDLRRWS